MVVAPRVREIENEIDSKVRALKIWQRPKQAVLADIMQAYRDSIEVVFAECLFFQLHAEHDRAAAGGIGVVRAQENRWRAGTLWALKWASEFCPEDGGTGSSRPEELADLLTLGAMYETFVDALKRANHGSRDGLALRGGGFLLSVPPTGVGFINTANVISGGCRRPRIASTTSGASGVSQSTRPI
jgi:hypothetical protein